jgi:hypothetical protein
VVVPRSVGVAHRPSAEATTSQGPPPQRFPEAPVRQPRRRFNGSPGSISDRGTVTTGRGSLSIAVARSLCAPAPTTQSAQGVSRKMTNSWPPPPRLRFPLEGGDITYDTLGSMRAEPTETLAHVLASATRLQRVVPDAVLVGGAAAAYYADHRDSFDHDHVLTDLSDRYAQVLEAVEATEGWVTSVRASTPPLTLLGRLGASRRGYGSCGARDHSRSSRSTSPAKDRCACPPCRRSFGSRPI